MHQSRKAAKTLVFWTACPLFWFKALEKYESFNYPFCLELEMIDVLIKEFSCIILCVPRFSAVCIESLRFSLHRSDTIVPARGHHIGLEIANWPRNPIGGNIDCGFCLKFKCFSWKRNVCAKIRRSIWASVWCYVRQKQMKCWWQRWLIRPCYPVPCNHLLTRPNIYEKIQEI